VECKNYAERVGVKEVEELKSKLEDVGGNLGNMICPLGFTTPARNRAAFDGIRLYEVSILNCRL